MSDPAYLPIFEALAARDLPIWLHPFRGADVADYKTEDRSQYEIWWTFGWPYETSAAMARLVFAGYFDRFPSLKIITHHMGAMAPYFAGRVGPGWDQLGARTSDEDYASLLKRLKKRPLDYFKEFYGDTALAGARAPTVCGISFFTADRVVFASDCPFDPEKGKGYIRATIEVIESLDLSKDDREKICHRNAEDLFGLKRS
jgi:predicted TIM-barrel fold metal-dependent hydrolase